MPDDGLGDRHLLSPRGVTKRYGGVHALGGVDFSLRAGEIHALLGENGAGKSTLINVLGELVRPDSGTVEVNGQRVEIRHVTDADRLGIRVIHQELSLAPNLSVAENLFLGREPLRFGLLDRHRMFEEAQRLIALLGLPEALVATLSTARQQMVEIARALGVRSRVLILDEPTSSLSEAETAALFNALRRLREQGVGVIYISHRLEEVRRIARLLAELHRGSDPSRVPCSRLREQGVPRPSRVPGTCSRSREHGTQISCTASLAIHFVEPWC